MQNIWGDAPSQGVRDWPLLAAVHVRGPRRLIVESLEPHQATQLVPRVLQRFLGVLQQLVVQRANRTPVVAKARPAHSNLDYVEAAKAVRHLASKRKLGPVPRALRAEPGAEAVAALQRVPGEEGPKPHGRVLGELALLVVKGGQRNVCFEAAFLFGVGARPLALGCAGPLAHAAAVWFGAPPARIRREPDKIKVAAADVTLLRARVRGRPRRRNIQAWSQLSLAVVPQCVPWQDQGRPCEAHRSVQYSMSGTPSPLPCVPASKTSCQSDSTVAKVGAINGDALVFEFGVRELGPVHAEAEHPVDEVVALHVLVHIALANVALAPLDSIPHPLAVAGTKRVLGQPLARAGNGGKCAGDLGQALNVDVALGVGLPRNHEQFPLAADGQG